MALQAQRAPARTRIPQCGRAVGRGCQHRAAAARLPRHAVHRVRMAPVGSKAGNAGVPGRRRTLFECLSSVGRRSMHGLSRRITHCTTWPL